MEPSRKCSSYPCFSLGELEEPSHRVREAPVAGTTTIGVAVEQTDIVTKGWRYRSCFATGLQRQNQKIGKIEDFIVALTDLYRSPSSTSVDF